MACGRRTLRPCGLGLLAMAAATTAAAEPQSGAALAHIRAAGVLRVGTTGDYPPFSFRDPVTGDLQGSDIDMAADLARRLQVRLELVPTTWRTLLADQSADRFDLAMGGISESAERRAQGFFSVPYLQDGKTPIVRCADATRYQTLAQIDQAGVRVIVNPGGTNERFVRAHLGQASLQVFGDNTRIFDELVAGHADVMITDAIEARLQHQLRPSLCAVHPRHPFDHSPKAYLLPRDTPFKRVVDRWLRGRLQTDTAQATLARWLSYDWPRGAAASAAAVVLAQLIDERLTLMPDVARYKWNQKAAIEDLPRERQLIESVRQQALQRGLSPDRAEAFFAAQIEASKLIQRELFARWEVQGQGRFEVVRDLAGDIRPKLDSLNPQLLAALAAVPERLERRELGPMPADAISAAAVQVALKPLLGAGTP